LGGRNNDNAIKSTRLQRKMKNYVRACSVSSRCLYGRHRRVLQPIGFAQTMSGAPHWPLVLLFKKRPARRRLQITRGKLLGYADDAGRGQYRPVALGAPCIRMCRTASEAASTGRTARNTAPTAALNLDESAKHMAERRSIVTPTGPVSSRRPDSITEARLRSETMARGRC